MTDQQRGDALGIAGHPTLLTPMVLVLAGVPIPASVDGKSLLPLLQGGQEPVRQYLHGEHAGATANHYLTNGRMKYIWHPQSGREQLFNLTDDPAELHDLAAVAANREDLESWRDRLVKELANRPEGFCRDGRLVAGRPYGPLIPGVGSTIVHEPTAAR